MECGREAITDECSTNFGGIEGRNAACEKRKIRRERQEPTRKETRFISNQTHDSSYTHLLLRPALVVGCRWANSFDDGGAGGVSRENYADPPHKTLTQRT